MATKKTSGKKTGGKRVRKNPPLKERVGKGNVVFFMGQLIVAGYLGDAIPESNPEKRRAAMELRRMAEKLAAAALHYGEDDVAAGGLSGAAEE